MAALPSRHPCLRFLTRLPSIRPCSYATYVDALEACSRDNLEYVKDRAVKALFELLSAKPEQARRVSVCFALLLVALYTVWKLA